MVEEETEVQNSSVHKITLSDPTAFIESLKVIDKLMDEVNFEFTNDGLEIRSMDAPNVAMVVFKHSSAGFTEYLHTADNKYGVKLGELLKVLDRIDKKGILRMEFSDHIVINSIGKSKKEFKLPLLGDLSNKDQKVPALTFKAVIKAKGKEIAEAIDDCSLIYESVHLTVENNKAFMKSFGDGIKTSNIEINGATATAQDGKAECKYAGEYLSKMIEGRKISEDVTLSFSSEYPLQMEFKSGYVELKIILAPRISNEND